MKSIVPAVLASLTLTVAGCDSVRVIEPGDGQNYYDGAFEYATQGGEIDTIVLGSPFGPAASNVPALTTDHMKGATRGRVVTFAPVDWSTPGDAFRVVVLFNGAPPFTADDVCSNGTDIGTNSADASTPMFAAFCQGAHLISFAHGAVGNLKGPDDPRFRDLVRQVTLAMIPAVDKNEISNDGSILP